MKKNKLSRYFLIVTLLTFFTIFVLLVQKSYENLIKAQNEAKKSSLIKPIDPNLKIEVLDEIEKHQEFPPQTQ
jgi:Mg/Co/Ni transporter MgtE